MAGWIKMPLGTEVNLGPGEVVLDGVSALPLKGAQPQFSVHVYCGQTAGWMKTPLGTEVDLGPGQTVLDGDQLPRERGTAAPLFSPMSIVATVAHLSYCWALVIFTMATDFGTKVVIYAFPGEITRM